VRESLLFKRTANDLPSHIKVFDVLQYVDEKLASLPDVTPIIIMEEAKHDDYFSDLSAISKQQKLEARDIKRIKIIAQQLAHIHSKRSPSEHYFRYLKDWFGFGILELTNELDGICTDDEIKNLKYLFIDWEHFLAKHPQRCRRIHGELFPGTIKFSPQDEFITYDMRRIGAGEPADDVGSLVYNYLFHSIVNHKTILPCFAEAAELFLKTYIEESHDNDIVRFLPVFMAYRCLICIHPNILPISLETKKSLKKLLYVLLEQSHVNIKALVSLYHPKRNKPLKIIE
jgi:hypothetical protein